MQRDSSNRLVRLERTATKSRLKCECTDKDLANSFGDIAPLIASFPSF